VVAVDGSKFKAVNARDRNFTPGKVQKRQAQIEESIKRYLDALDTADRTQAPAEFQAKAEHLQDKLRTMREQMILLKQQPGMTIADLKALRLSNEPAYVQQTETHIYAGLRKAGIPEM